MIEMVKLWIVKAVVDIGVSVVFAAVVILVYVLYMWFTRE